MFFSIAYLAQGFVKGAVIQYKGKDGKMIKGKFVEISYYKILKIDDVVKIRSTQGKEVNVLMHINRGKLLG